MIRDGVLRLEKPVCRGKQAIKSIKIQSIEARHLEGVSLISLADGDDKALLSVLSLITTPKLAECELKSLSRKDLIELKIFTLSSLLTREQKKNAGIA